MEILHKKNLITDGSVCAIGSFDGVHKGHKRIVEYLKHLSDSERKIGIITFDPLPFFVLKKAPVCCLTPKKEKEEIFRMLGVDFIYYFEFTKDFAQLSPAKFVKLIATEIEPSIVVVGENFHFGKTRTGTAESLKELANKFFTVEIMPRVLDEGTISSTRIRELLLLGNVKAVNRLLGREYSISGEVIRGKGKGQRLGFPTINLEVSKQKLMPLDGVYKVKVLFDNNEYLGALFCRNDLLEVHIIGFSGNLYRKLVNIKFLERIRSIEHFVDDQSLKSAIAKDIRMINK